MNASGQHPSLDVDSARPIVEAVFGEYAHRLRLPSIAWGVVADGQLVLGENEAAIYRIASMTKSFTCAALLILRDEGRLLLDDPITDHAPEFSGLGVPTADSPPITIRHLMTMSSGLATDDAWADRHLDMTDEQLDDIVAGGLNFAAAPGTTFEYSNLGFAILGRVVRNITRATVQRLISDRLLSPLGMGDTTWTEPVGAVPGYRQGGDDPPADPAGAQRHRRAAGGQRGAVGWGEVYFGRRLVAAHPALRHRAGAARVCRRPRRSHGEGAAGLWRGRGQGVGD